MLNALFLHRFGVCNIFIESGICFRLTMGVAGGFVVDEWTADMGD